MTGLEHINFTLQQILSLIGLTQCVLILVYMAFRSGRLSRAGLPFAYFAVLGAAFTLDFGRDFIGSAFPWYPVLQWLAWFSGPPLSVLLVVQIARITEVPAPRFFLILLAVPASFLASALLAVLAEHCPPLTPCREMFPWLEVMGLLAGAASLLVVWLSRGVMDAVQAGKEGGERFWLIIALIAANILLLGVELLALGGAVTDREAAMIRTVLGIAFVYLATTSLFRIYPPSVKLEGTGPKDGLTEAERDLARKIEILLEREKIYHEAAYSRTDLARELETSETVVSRIINIHFGKSFPQLLNERRVEDAKRLLRETKVPVRAIAEEAGFNSIASFNRVFKDLTGETPGAYRQGTEVE